MLPGWGATWSRCLASYASEGSRRRLAPRSKSSTTGCRWLGTLSGSSCPRVFRSRRVGLLTKVVLYRVAVLSVLLYGAAESWAPTESPAAPAPCVTHHLPQAGQASGWTGCLRLDRLVRVANEELFARSVIDALRVAATAQLLAALGRGTWNGATTGAGPNSSCWRTRCWGPQAGGQAQCGPCGLAQELT